MTYNSSFFKNEKILLIVLLLVVVTPLIFKIPYGGLVFCYDIHTSGNLIQIYSLGKCGNEFSDFIHSNYFQYILIPFGIPLILIVLINYRHKFLKTNISVKKSIFIFMPICLLLFFSSVVFTPYDSSLSLFSTDGKHVLYNLNSPYLFPIEDLIIISENLVNIDQNSNCVLNPTKLDQICINLKLEDRVNYIITRSFFSDFMGIDPTIEIIDELKYDYHQVPFKMPF